VWRSVPLLARCAVDVELNAVLARYLSGLGKRDEAEVLLLIL
jgi:hypothetical protein